MRPSSDSTPRTARAATMVAGLAALAFGLAATAPSRAAPQVDQNGGTWTDNLADNAGLATNVPESFDTLYRPASRLVTLADTALLACRQAPCAADEAPGKYGQLATTSIAPVSFSAWGKAYLEVSASTRPELMSPTPADVEVRFLGNNGTTYGPFQLAASDDARYSAMVDLSTVPVSVTSGRLLVFLRERVIVLGVRDDDTNRPVGDPTDIRILPTYKGAKVTWGARSVVNVAISAPATTCSNAPFNVRVRVAVSLVNVQDLIVYVPLVTPAADTFGLTYPLAFSKATDNGKYTESGTVIRGVTIPARSVYWEFGTRNAGNTWVVSYDVTPPAGTLNGTLYSATAQARSLNVLPTASPTPAETAVISAPAPTIKLTAGVEGECLVGGEIPGDERQLTYTLTTANQPGSTCSEHYHRAVVYQDLADLVTPTEGTAFGSVFHGTPPAAFTLSAGGQYTAGGTTLHGVVIPPNSVFWDLGTLDVGESQTRTVSMDLKATTRFGGPIPVGHVAESTAVIRSGVRAQTASSYTKVGFGYSGFGGISYHYSEQIRAAIGSTRNVNDNASLSVGYGDRVNYGLVVANESASTLVDTVLVQKIPAGASLAAALSTSSSYVVRYHLGGAANADDVPPDFTRATHTFGPSWTSTPPADLTTVNWVAVDVPFIYSDVPDECTGTSLGGGSDINVTVPLVIDPPVNGCAEASITNRGLFHTRGVLFPGDATPTPIPDTGTWALSDPERVDVKPVLPGLSAMRVSASPSALVGPGQVTFTVVVPNEAVGAAQTDTARDAVVTLNMPRMSINGVLQPLQYASAKAKDGVIDYSALPDQLIVRYATIAPKDSRTIELAVDVPSGFVSGHSLTLTAQATAQDDVCGQVTGSASRSVIATGNSYLEVTKRVDLPVADRGSEVVFELSYTNKGETVSTGSWIVDQVPANVTLASARPVANSGQVWFSNQAAPTLPSNLRATSPVWTGALVRANFVQGVEVNGEVVPPSGFGTVTWIAFLVDDGALTPPLLKTGGGSKVFWTATIDALAPIGEPITNLAAIFSSELLPAISNEAATLISEDPSLEVLRSCPDVTSAGDELTYLISWVNNSTNDDYQVRLIETLPDFVTFVSATHTWNAAGQAQFGAVDVQPTWDADARTLTWAVSDAIDPTGATPIGSLIGGELAVTVRIANGTPTGTFASLSGVALANDLTETRPLALATGCSVLVENPDLYVRIGIDQAEPISGETVTYTVIASNMGANLADDTSLVVTLPLGVSYAGGPGGVSIFASPGWAFDGTSEPDITTDAQGREVLTWSLATNNALWRSDLAVGRFPGRSGAVNIAFPALVAPTVAPNTTLTATAVIATPAVEDQVYPNTDSVSATTPLPDPKVDKSGPAFAQPGASITYRLQYSNESRQPAPSVFLVDRLWDDAPGDGQADVALTGVTVANGEVVYYNDAPLTGLEPGFDPDDPAATGWRTAIGGAPVNWIGLYRETLAGNAGPYSVYVDVALRHPLTGQEPQAGATIVNRATIRIPNDTDKDTTNNQDEVETQTPGVDIGAALECDPNGAYPGTSPGQEVGARLVLMNNGTTRAYGLRFGWQAPSWFELLADDANTVLVTSATGEPRSVLDQNGLPVSGPVSWTRTATGYVLGDLSPSSPRYYRKLGIPAGARATISVSGRVRPEVAHDAQVTQELTVATDYHVDFDPQTDEVEQITVNNTAGCATRVYRADPRVIKTAGGVAATAPFTAGQQLEYDIAYNNIGGAPAEGVFLEDQLPDGTSFVVGSMSNVPLGTTVTYDDGSGTFTYAPSGVVGALDPGVKAFRVTWDEALPAPAGATFAQETRFDFEDGTFVNTRVSDDGESVIVVGAGDSRSGTYTTPAIPADGAAVAEWGHVVVKSAAAAAGAMTTVSILDAETGATIQSGLIPDVSGAVGVDVDAARYPRIQVEAELIGTGTTCAEANLGVKQLTLEYQRPPSYDVMGCSPGGDVLGSAESEWDSDVTFGVIWQRQGDGSYTVERLPRASGGREIANFAIDDDTILGTAESVYGDQLAVWQRVDGTWRRVEIGGEPAPEDASLGWNGQVWGYDTLLVQSYFDDSAIGAYYGDGGQWKYRSLGLSEGDYCNAYMMEPVQGAIFLSCSISGVERPVIFRPSRPGSAAFELLPLPPGAPTFYWAESVVGHDQDLAVYTYYNDNGRETYLYEWRGTEWEVHGPLVGPDDEPFVPSMFGTNTELAGRLNSSRPAFAVRETGGWTVSYAPMPAGYDWASQGRSSYFYAYASNGAWILQYRFRSGPDRYAGVFRRSDGSYGVRLLSASALGGTQEYYQGITNGAWLAGTYTGGGSNQQKVLWEPILDGSGEPDFIARAPGASFGGASYAFKTTPSRRPIAERQAWSSCGTDVIFGGDGHPWATARATLTPTTFLADPMPLTQSVPSESYPRMSGTGAAGAVFGQLSQSDGRFRAVVFVPDPQLALRGYELPPHPDHRSVDYRVTSISPDHRTVIGSFNATVLGVSQTFMIVWRYDETSDAYLLGDVRGLPVRSDMSASPEAEYTGYRYPTLDALAGGISIPGVGGFSGTWFYGASTDEPLVWLPDVLPDTRVTTLMGGGEGFAVVNHVTNSDPGGQSTRYLVVEADASSPSGVKSTPLGRPAGFEDRLGYMITATRRSDLLLGALRNAGDNAFVGFLWRSEGAAGWVPYRLAAADGAVAQHASRRRFGPQQLPLLYGTFPNSASGILQPVTPSGGISFGPPTFANLPGFTGFTPGADTRSLATLPVYAWSGHEGIITGRFTSGGGPTAVGYQYLAEDLTWKAVRLPGLETSGETLFVDLVTPGPVIYGTSAKAGRNTKVVAWTFPGGDLASPVIFDVSGALGQSPSGFTYQCTWSTYTFAKPGVDGYSDVVLPCSSIGGGYPYAVVSPGPEGVRVKVTEAAQYMTQVFVGPDSEVLLARPNSFYPNEPWRLLGCSPGGGIALDSLQVQYRTDEDPSFQYRVEVDDVCQVAVTNTARVYTSSAQISETNDESAVTSDVETTDLGVEVEADRGSVLAGQTVTYTATVTNRGPGVARDVALTLDWPNGAGVGGTRELQTIASLSPGEVRTFTKSVTVTTDTANVRLDAAALVETSTIDCDLGDDLALASTLTGEIPNVAVTVTGPATWQIGDSAEYVATAFNDGTVTANDVTLRVTIPPYGTLQQVLVDGVGLDVTCTQSTQVVTCDIASLEPLDQGGVPAVVTLVMVNPSCEDADGAFDVDATVDAALDANAADNADQTSTTILGAPGALTLVATPSRSTVRTGEALTWFIHYQNDGTEAVTGAVLVATVPTGATLDATGTTPGYSQNGATLSWPLPSLAPARGGTIALAVTATGAAPTALSGVAQIDLPEGSNACEVATTMSGASITGAGLHVVKRASASVGCGAPIAWLITLTNDGATDLRDLTITDSVPAQSPYISGSIAGEGAAVVGPQSLSWTIGELAAGASVTVGFSSQAPASSGLVVSNIATVLDGGAVVGTSAPATVWATCDGAALVLTKSWTTACALEGESVEVVVSARNDGAQTISAALIADPLPAGFTFLASTTGATLDATTDQVTQTASSLLPGQTVTMRYSASVTGQAGELALGAATVTGAGVQPQVSNPVGAAILDCDDGLACTVDTCDAVLGCVNTPPDLPETICDGLDDNCNGAIDEDLTRVVTCGVGACSNSSTIETCVAGEWSGPACEPLLGATTETCNGIDDDCDGQPDEELPTTRRLCTMTGGCPGVVTIGCVAGDQGPVGPCTLAEPIEDLCDGVDADCDGQTDEDAEPAVGVVDLCDGIDDDCDGQTDEDSETSVEVCTMVGGCTGVVTIGCFAGDEGPVGPCTLAEPIEDLCDGVDDDCDGQTDEDSEPTTGVCTLPGGCGGTTTLACVGGVMVAVGECVASGTVTDHCDGVDNDCDGQTDEDFVPVPARCGEDTCGPAVGVTTCECGEPGVACDPAWDAMPDAVCSASGVTVAYAIVNGADGKPAGTVRCTQDGEGAVECDRDPEDTSRFRVYPELWCPGASPAPEPRECASAGWSKAFGPSPDWIEPYGLGTDASGNIYVTGYMSDAVDLGGGALAPALGETTWDLFYAKYTPAGDHVWSRRVNALSTDSGSQGTGVFVDAAGQVYLSAQVYQGGAFEIGGQVVSSSDDAMVVMKLDALGDPLWIRTFEGFGQWQQPIVVDAVGRIFVATRLRSDGADFGDGPLAYSGERDAIAFGALDASGASLSSVMIGGITANVYNAKLSLGPSGTVILGADFDGTLTIGADTLVAEGQDAFVALFAPDGTPLWSRKLGGSSEDELVSVGATPAGEIVCVGSFRNSTSWGGPTLTSPLGDGGVIARFSATGDYLSSHIIATAADGRLWLESARVGPGGDVVVAGAFEGVVEVGGVTLTATPFVADAFFAVIRPDGTAPWAISSHGTPHPDNPWAPDGWPYDVAWSPSGAVVGAGYIVGQADFGFGPFVSGGEGAHMMLLSVPPGGPQ